MFEFNLLEQPLRQGDQLLIEASAGTGKTTTLENLVLRLLLEGITTSDGESREITLQEILVVTFTEAATSELIQRVRDNISRALHLLRNDRESLEEDNSIAARVLRDFLEKFRLSPAEKIHIAQMRLRMALLSFDESAISTIHGFCSKMLSEFAFESGLRFDLELTEDESSYLDETAHDYWRRSFYAPDRKFYAALAATCGVNVDVFCRALRQLKGSPLVEIAVDNLPLDKAEKNLNENWQELLKYCSRPEVVSLLNENADNFKKKARLAITRLVNMLRSQDLAALLGCCCGLKKADLCSGVKLKGAAWQGVKDKNPVKGEMPADLMEIFGRIDSFRFVVSEYLIALRLDFIEFALKGGALEQKKTAAGVQAFDDLLLGMFRAVEDCPDFRSRVRRRYPVVLIDEFQDTDPLQFRIFERTFNHSEALMIMVGDPKQSIYQFRGADIYSYLQVAEQLPVTSRSTLSHNFRSSPELLEAFNTVFDLENPFIENSIGYIPATAGRTQRKLIIEGTDVAEKPLRILEINSPDGQAVNKTAAYDISRAAVCSEISFILKSAGTNNEAGLPGARFEDETGRWCPVEPRDIAVLTDTNAEAQKICAMLAERGIPAVLQNTGNIFEAQQAAAELLHIMAATEEPREPRRVLTALAAKSFGFTYEELYMLAADNELLEPWQEFFFLLLKVWQEHGFIRFFYELLKPRVQCRVRCDVRAQLLSAPQGERCITDLLHLGELLHKVESRQRLGPSALTSWLRRRMTEPEAGTEHERRLESDEKAVKIMTAHKSKGLQFPIVFCTSLWKRGCLPGSSKKELDFFFHERDESGDYKQYFEFGIDGGQLESHCRAYRREQLAENIRLVYVALTRAGNYCSFTFGSIKNTEDSALAYLAGAYSDDELEELYKKRKPDTRRQLHKWRACGRIAFCKARMDSANVLSRSENRQLNDPPAIRSFVRDWGILSFTALTAGSHLQGEVRPGADDEPDNESAAELPPAVSSKQLPLGDFPGGPVSGDCIHQIFEKIDFSLIANDRWHECPEVKALIDERLVAMGRVEGARGTEIFRQALQKRRWQVCDMLQNVLRCPLPGKDGNFRLCDLPAGSHLPEMEFYFPVAERIDYKQINCLIELLAGQEGNLSTASGSQPLYGFMNGLIDLVFEYKGCYYIIDWKTNNLGSGFTDYRQDTLAESMFESNYLLQAAIYTLALDKYLKTRINGYDYQKHFGGVFYLYVRGIMEETAEFGVYSLKPPSAALQMLESIFPAHLED
ncbi:exodeoxyribonuclease V subunit beta [Lentisphaerota bacterium ZTH]|nr:exodeoxyribonuclease V subunit beta [Lentisphaerota bacterium]WET06581.1 exodeoxyribonuclease V subunit beta [Lentisphaerota bacterium ZTH]